MITPNKQRKTIRVFHKLTTPLLALAATLLAPAVLSPILNTQAQALAQPSRNADFPPFDEVAKDFTRVVSTTDESSFYTLWRRDKDQQLLAELPRGFERQRHFFAMTVSSGELFAGLQGNDLYVYWKRYDNRLALIAPELNTRSTGDAESRTSVERIFTDRVLLDVPILTMGPGGGPVIDFNNLLLGSAGTFFGSSARGLNPRLATITKAKAFPENIVVAFEAPTAGGILKSFTYSISLLKGSPSYKPREADPRVGYFTTSYRDLGKFSDDEKWVRYINRWHIEKQDPSRRLSPPKEPIVFYVEHTVPIRYRRFVRQGIDYWNKAFENIGIVDAIEVRYQDAESGSHMEKDPEDVRYNFIRWLSNDIGTAIGPSRVNPNTGQILDADVILTDGWIRYFWFQYNTLMPELLMDGFTPETLAWLEQNPRWDPRLRMANPAQREQILAQRAAERARGITRFGGHPVSQASSTTFGQNEFDGLAYRTSQFNGLCMAATGKAIGMTMMRMHLEMATALSFNNYDDEDPTDNEPNGQPDKPKLPEADMIDGVPDWFVGPMLADLVAHEVGHTLGLRHNFRASALYSLEEVNSQDFKGVKPFTASVMDYNPINIFTTFGEKQGDYSMIDIGKYDIWAIEYGYTTKDHKAVLANVDDPALAYLTDEDTWGPDPLARRYDFSSNPLDYAQNQIQLVNLYRSKILDKFVKDGESWAKARRGYLVTLGMQSQSISMMANWIGGAHVSRNFKGDPGNTPPLTPVPAQQQREALNFVIAQAFQDDSFGLTPELLSYMTIDKWWDSGGMRDIFEDPTWPVHDRVLGLQAAALTALMNPTTLQRIYDNEFRVPSDQDALTLAELFDTLSREIFSELANRPSANYTARQPMISSLRRNLQREFIERLIDLSMPSSFAGAAEKPVSNLAIIHLRTLKKHIDDNHLAANSANRLDPYTRAHLAEASSRIERALDAVYIYNTDQIGGAGSMPFLFFTTPPQDDHNNRR